MSFFEGKTAIITGAGGTIGTAIADRLAQAGSNIILVDYNEDALKEAIASINISESRYLAVKADVSKEEDVKAYVKKQ